MKKKLTEEPGELFMQLIVAFALMLFCLVPAGAQELTPPKAEVKVTVGASDFDLEGSSNDTHVVVGGSVRFYLTRRLSVEPEFLYMRESERDQDFVFAPNLAFDIVDPRKKVVPYVIGGVGVLHHRSNFGSFRSSANTWNVSAGGGVKIFLNDRLFIAPEARVGWEPVVRGTVSVGYVFSGREKR